MALRHWQSVFDLAYELTVGLWIKIIEATLNNQARSPSPNLVQSDVDIDAHSKRLWKDYLYHCGLWGGQGRAGLSSRSRMLWESWYRRHNTGLGFLLWWGEGGGVLLWWGDRGGVRVLCMGRGLCVFNLLPAPKERALGLS